MPRSINPERGSVPPPGEERATARKLTAAPASLAADSTRSDIAQEDFLFHLYRGSELLQENRVLEAKEELEHALTMQPTDTKGQDLLAAVYFRIGHYARAIGIYEQLERVFPAETSLKINIALCYLKTSQPSLARAALYDVVRINPSHRRAWGYLGIAHEQLGEFDQAQIAFERGGHAVMAKKMAERRNRATVPAPAMPVPDAAAPEVAEREPAGVSFEDLDAGELNFALAEPGTSQDKEGWKTVELGAATAAPPAPNAASPATPPQVPKVPSPFAKTLGPPEARADALTVNPPPSARYVPLPTPPISRPPPEMAQAARDSLLRFPTESAVVLHATGVALVQTRA